MPKNKILLNGARGRMGKAIEAIFSLGDFPVELVKVDQNPDQNILKLENRLELTSCDLAIDFSAPAGTGKLLDFCLEHKIPCVVGTTGLDAVTEKKISGLSQIVPVVYASNYSIGVNLLAKLVALSAEILDEGFEPEIMEVHHHGKKDAPSGTALYLAQTLAKARNWDENSLKKDRSRVMESRESREIGIQSLRGGAVAGEHTVFFFGENERLELTHRARDRKIFAQGAVKAALWLFDKDPGLYDMHDVLGF